jgi:alpha-mannosidase
MATVREILLVPHTHHDVGYTNSPRIVLPMHRRIVGEVLDLCESSPDGLPETMRWTFEVSRPVVDFLDRAGAGGVERLRSLQQAGRVSLTGGYLNMTQLPGIRELERSFAPVRRFRDAGVDVRVVQHGDVNGLSWGAVPTMNANGIDTLVMALNPDHGRAPFEQPSAFWWEGPDSSRVLVWLSVHYGFGEQWGIIDGDVVTASGRLAEFVDTLTAREDYPFDFALVHAANDNRWPTAHVQEVVRGWNAAHPECPARLVTIDEAMRRVRDTEVELPVVRGEWADWWSHGHGSSARELAVYRQARTLLHTAETAMALSAIGEAGETELSRVIGWRRAPVRLRDRREVTETVTEIYDQLLLFGEHTWGSWESVSDPDSMFTRSHWNAKADFAYAAHDHARDLYVEGLFCLLGSKPDDMVPRKRVVVFNPTNDTAAGPVTVELPGKRVTTVVTGELPPFGLAELAVPSADPRDSATGRVLENDRFRIEVDPKRGGVVSLVDRESGFDLVDHSSDLALGSVVYEDIPAGSEHPMVTDDRKEFHPDNPGPDFRHRSATGVGVPEIERFDGWALIRWEGSGPSMPRVRTELRIHDGLDLIDLHVTIDKQSCQEAEGVFVSFPFALTQPEFDLETAGAVFRADGEQLPDSCRDWYSIQHAIGITGAGAGGVLWGSVDAPLVQLGGFQTGRWAHALEASAGHVHCWLMNNLYFTNFKAEQSGVDTFRFRFAPRPDGVTAAEVRRFGSRLATPPAARVHAGRAPGEKSFLRVTPGESVLAELAPGVDGGTAILRLRSLSAEPLTARVSGPIERAVQLPPLGTEDVVLTRP